MINWDKPIETVDGRKAKLLSCVMPVGGDYSSGRAVYVSPPPGAVFGDVFLVDEEGFRCDNAVGIHRPQIIRNARVKREGWALVRREHGAPVFSTDWVYSSKKAAEEDRELKGGIPAFVTWEEEP